MKVLLVVIVCSTVCYSQLVPKIFTPKTTYEVGELAVFSAESTTYAPRPTLIDSGQYRWDFGDNCYCKKNWPSSAVECQAIAIAHYFMFPGTYSVKLYVKLFTTFDGDKIPTGDSLAYDSTTISILVTGTAVKTNFSVEHAQFENRIDQFCYVQIPSVYRANTTRLKVKYGTDTVFNDDQLSAEETLTIVHGNLDPGTYLLEAWLYNGDDMEDSCYWKETFVKRYDDTPKVAIDRYNNIYINKKPKFIMGNFQVRFDNIQTRIDSSKINALWTQGYDAIVNDSSWKIYMNQALNKNLYVIGPGRGDYGSYYWKHNSKIIPMLAYLDSMKTQTNVIASVWHDEPNLGASSKKWWTPSQAAYNKYVHDSIPNILDFQLLYGYSYTNRYDQTANTFDYQGSKQFFGGKKWVQQTMPFDIYYNDYRDHFSLNTDTAGPLHLYLSSISNLNNRNRGLVPIIPVQQPGEELAGDDDTPPPKPEEVYMLSWLNVISGGKGVVWFNTLCNECSEWAMMRKFATEIDSLEETVLSNPVTNTVTDNSNSKLRRVDNLIRKNGDTIYLFSGRVTEPDTIDPLDGWTATIYYKGVEPDTIINNFSVSGMPGTWTAQRVFESGTFSVTDGIFSDKFDKYEINIYKMYQEQVQRQRRKIKLIF